MHPAGRAERRRLMRLTLARWMTFVRAIKNGQSWESFRDWTPDERNRFISLLASGCINWKGSDHGRKAILRRRRKQQEAERQRVDIEVSDDASDADE